MGQQLLAAVAAPLLSASSLLPNPPFFLIARLCNPNPNNNPSLSLMTPSSSICACHHLPLNNKAAAAASASKRMSALSLDDVPPNALRRNRDPLWRGGFTLGVDLGLSRTGLALSKGFSIRPLTVLELRGQKLELKLLEIAEQKEADEFIIGLPRSNHGKETPQSNKVRSVAGRFAVQAAKRGWRVYLQDEHGTSTEAIDYMIEMGLSKSARQGRQDAYAAMMVLKRYFSTLGQEMELVLPKQLELQEKILNGPPKDVDFCGEDF